MKLLYGKLYRKYYPIKSPSIFYEMDEKECDILTRYIKNIEEDIFARNVESEMQALRKRTGLCRQIKVTYPKPIDNLYSLLKKRQFSRLDEEVLYRYKYNSIISCFIFPTNKRLN